MRRGRFDDPICASIDTPIARLLQSTVFHMHVPALNRMLRRAVCAVAVVLALWTVGPPVIAVRASAPPEVRALWVLRSSLTTPAGIETLVHTARGQGFNALLVQIRGRGDAYYTSTLEQRAAELVRQPATFDPLATVIAEAHKSGLRVHAWMNMDLVSSAVELPAARVHIIYRHP